MKKNNTAEKSAIEAKNVSKALKESTEKTLRNIINEALSDVIANDDDEELNDDESYEVEDVNTEASEPAAEPEAEEGADAPEAEEPETEEGGEEVPEEEDAEDEWADMDDYKVGDNDYDFTGADEETALKVYSKLGDDDQIFIKKEDDGTYTMKDNDTDAEYVIELGDEEEEPEDDFEDEPESENDEELDIELGDDEEPEADDEIEVDLDGEDEPEEDNELEIDLDNEDEPENVEDNPENDEPEDVEGDNEDDDEDEIDESGAARTSVKKSHMVKGDKEKPEGFPARGPQAEKLNEAIKKMIAQAKSIQAENKQYKAAIESIKESLMEAAALNVNYGKVVSLLVNESMTKDEKKSIVERFNNVKTINEGTQLYNSIKKELNEAKKSTKPIVERQINVNDSKTLNETTIYQPMNNPSISLMERMERIGGRKK